MAHRSPVDATTQVNAAERNTGDRPRLANGNREDAVHAVARRSAVFARLPASDQEWVLTQAMARVQEPSDPELLSLVNQLSEVRLFAASEREEPMPPEPSR